MFRGQNLLLVRLPPNFFFQNPSFPRLLFGRAYFSFEIDMPQVNKNFFTFNPSGLWKAYNMNVNEKQGNKKSVLGKDSVFTEPFYCSQPKITAPLFSKSIRSTRTPDFHNL